MSEAEPVVYDLTRALQALGRCQRRFLDDVITTCDGDPRFLDAFRRWEETLTLLKVYLHRVEGKLLHLLRVPPERRSWKELPPAKRPQPEGFAQWNRRLAPYLHALHIDTTYRRIGDVLDLDAQAATADAVTDLVACAEICDTTMSALELLHRHDQPVDVLEELAFFHVLAPWKKQGMPALFDALRWLNAYIAEHDTL